MIHQNGKCVFLILFSIVSINAIASPSVFAQGNVNSTGTGGRHTIQGAVFLPNGTRPEFPIKVELQSTTYSSLSIIAEKNGNFAFKSLSPGSYTVVVDLDDPYEIARENITVDPDVIATRTTMSAKVITIPVYLQFRNAKKRENDLINVNFAKAPKQAVKHYETALELSKDNKVEESIGELKDAIAIYPEFSMAFALLGRQYLKLGKLEDSIEFLRKSINFDSKNFDAKLDLGIAYLNNKELDEAKKQLEEAIVINHKAVTPHYYLGLVFIQKRKLDDAQKELELVKKLKREIDLPLVHKYLGGIYWAKKEYRLAADELEKYIQFSSDILENDKIRQTIKELRSKQ